MLMSGGGGGCERGRRAQELLGYTSVRCILILLPCCWCSASGSRCAHFCSRRGEALQELLVVPKKMTPSALVITLISAAAAATGAIFDLCQQLLLLLHLGCSCSTGSSHGGCSETRALGVCNQSTPPLPSTPSPPRGGAPWVLLLFGVGRGVGGARGTAGGAGAGVGGAATANDPPTSHIRVHFFQGLLVLLLLLLLLPTPPTTTQPP